MTALITDRTLERRLIAQRQRLGLDRFDEVWDGVYIMAPLADVEHQGFATDLASVFTVAIKWAGLGESFAGINITDRRDDWAKNYRCPDVAVFLNGTLAENCGTHWFGGPDFAVEIVSPRDRTRKKLPFYEKIGTRELLIVDRRPWRLALCRLESGKLVEVGRSSWDHSAALNSKVVPLDFRLAGDAASPAIEVIHHDGQRKWLVRGGAGKSPQG